MRHDICRLFAMTLLYLAAALTAVAQTTVTTSGGTTNSIPKFTGTSTIGDSAIVENSGSVGIGITTPGAKLDVNGGIRMQGGNRQLTFNNGSSETHITQVDGGNPALSFDASVGIGTTAPTAKLEVDSSGQGSVNLLLMDSSTSSHFFAVPNASAGYANSLVQAGDQVFGYTGSGVDTGALVIAPWSASSKGIRIAPSGNVGIGTTNPQYPLSVNGTIQAKEVIVNTGWSDYVFGPDYRVRPLTEVAAFIKANHHLPDIPSEAEVKQNGVSLADMQAKLLAKIEELTLQMIQLNEKNRALEKKVAQLEQR